MSPDYVKPCRDIGGSVDQFAERYGALLGAYQMLSQEARVYRGVQPDIARSHDTECRRLIAAFGFRDDALWDIEIPYYDLAGDDELCTRFVSLRAPDEATACDRAEASLRAQCPSAHLLSERVTCRASSLERILSSTER